MTIESSLAIWTNIKNLREFELISIVHDQVAWNKNQEASRNWSWLNILMIDVVNYFLEAKRLYFFCNLLYPPECLPPVGHDAIVTIKVNQTSLVCHDCRIVLSEEFFWDGFKLSHEICFHQNLYKIFSNKPLDINMFDLWISQIQI